MDVSDNLRDLVENSSDTDHIEVLFGLDKGFAVGALTDRLGDDGQIVNHAGFDIYRAVVTTQRLNELLDNEPEAIAFVEQGTRTTGGIPTSSQE